MSSPIPPKPATLILVCCHAIYTSGPTRGLLESEWLLAPFQHGETPTFTQHIKTSLSLLTSSPSSILIFSGGPTRAETRRSEARGYLELCIENEYWGILQEGRGLRERIALEERALDSFQNLLLSIKLFQEKTGGWPGLVTIVSHAFKEARFMELHFPALGWPRERVRFVGVDPEYMVAGNAEYDGERSEEVRRGERTYGYECWEEDPLGEGGLLKGKRERRDPWGVGNDVEYPGEGEKWPWEEVS
ncbi:hypothetical protein BJ875DRAFT_479287 [Amylocarpus encephaloides]|uniref:DUF218 domain-containing protein n=1 Tax=Amylocarpus encephaloides TaxID=45428 RepID=A0A9P8CAL5_9HELO|nr:hypothetical protein BJ875DRAFT_479287 [Amylocarpus encephaloides]